MLTLAERGRQAGRRASVREVGGPQGLETLPADQAGIYVDREEQSHTYVS